jgi:AcrR family transcriptional regulator
MVPPSTCAPRLRNAAATRQAMLVAARHHFARDSYENVGLREIAAEAGVDPALVARYFGGKEQLFKEALRGDARPLLEGVAREDIARHFASLLFDDSKDEEQRSEKIDCLLIMLRSSTSTKASEIVREAMTQDLLQPMADALGGANAELRASLALAVLMGSGILRSSMGIDPLCEPATEQLRARLTALFAVALNEDVAA